jgi:hypothetical protein
MITESNGNSAVGNKRKVAILALTLLIAMVVVSVVAAGWFNPNISRNSNQTTNSDSVTGSSAPSIVPTSADSVSFTCKVGSNYEFTVSVGVDLNDGMNSTEAELVAIGIFEHEITNATFALKSAGADEAGIWTVRLSWEYNFQDIEPISLNHYFDVTINPLNQTVTYSRCF